MRHRKTLEPVWLGPAIILVMIVYLVNAGLIIASMVNPKHNECSEEAPDMVPAEFFPPAQP